MSDLISRADAICEVLVNDGIDNIVDRIKALPSAEYSKPLQTTLNGDLVSREDALMELNGVCSNWQDDAKVAEIIHALPSAEAVSREFYEEAVKANHGLAKDNCELKEQLESAEAEKKKAELKENGDWDCPDVGCDECDHHRSVEWCSLAIPNHEEIDETYKMVNEAFFEGFDVAEKRYRFLIETVEGLDKKLAEAVTIHEDGTLEVKVPNAQKVGRVLVMGTNSHIGGGLFYPDREDGEE